MCGILFHYKKNDRFEDQEDLKNNTVFHSLVPIIRERGGDYEQFKSFPEENIELYSSVLSLRQPLAKQPLVDDRFIIQFNGELYNDEISEGMNDVEYMHGLLRKEQNTDIIKTICCLKGEFAYTVVDKVENKVYFGKDILGRKSLCFSICNGEELLVSSCPPWHGQVRKQFIECENSKVYCYDISKGELTVIPFTESVKLPSPYKVMNNSNEEQFNKKDMINTLHDKLSLAVEKRVSTIFPLEKDKTKSKFAILFSGGIDCTLLAGLCGEICEEGTIIDLLNVSFSNPRAKLSYDETPDRMLAIKNCNELNKHYNDSKSVYFNLVKINVPYDEYLASKERVIKLIYPNDTEMDLSIAIAFYFAASGRNHEGEDSNCKVLLSGLGADELFGGYTRHERIFTGISNQIKRSLKNLPPKDTTHYDMLDLNRELRDELQCDLDRLWERNLTRDDKVISCWSKEVRYPFLDENLVSWITSEDQVPITWKLHLDVYTGVITRKKALRALAVFMGLSFVAEEAKRAIQFGSKSAKMDIGSGKMKGTDKLTQ